MMLTEPGGRGTFRLHLKELRRKRAFQEMRLEGNLHLLLALRFRRVVEGHLHRSGMSLARASQISSKRVIVASI